MKGHIPARLPTPSGRRPRVGLRAMPPAGVRIRATQQAAQARANEGGGEGGTATAAGAGAPRRAARERTGSTHEERDGDWWAPSEEQREEGGAGTGAVHSPANNRLRLFELEGKLAGQHAADERRHGRPYSIEPSEEVKAKSFLKSPTRPPFRFGT